MTVRLHSLSNGFRIVTEVMPSLESAAIGIWVQAGGRHERPEENGIAHFLEHMAFKGTERRTALQIAEEIEDVGGYINAYTSRETTAYYARVLRADVPLALDVVADIVLNPVFDAAEIEIERGVILQEIGQALDTPDDIIFDWLQEAAYPGQPIGRTILGPEERVGAFAREDFRQFVGTHYGPDRMILSAAGAVDHDSIVRQAEALFGHLAPRGPEHPEPARFSVGERRELKKLEQVHFALGFESPGYLHPDFYTAQIYAQAMGGGMSSRLFQEARENRGLAYAVDAYADTYEDVGVLGVYAGCAAGDAAELARICAGEIQGLATSVGAAELTRAKAQLKASMFMGREQPLSRAEQAAGQTLLFGRLYPAAEIAEAIDAVTAADFARLGERLTADRKSVVSVLGSKAAMAAPEAFEAALFG